MDVVLLCHDEYYYKGVVDIFLSLSRSPMKKGGRIKLYSLQEKGKLCIKCLSKTSFAHTVST